MIAAREYPTLPERVGSPLGKLVMLYVQVYEGVTVDQLERDLGLSTPVLVTLLDDLADRGVLAVEDGVVRLAATA